VLLTFWNIGARKSSRLHITQASCRYSQCRDQRVGVVPCSCRFVRCPKLRMQLSYNNDPSQLLGDTADALDIVYSVTLDGDVAGIADQMFQSFSRQLNWGPGAGGVRDLLVANSSVHVVGSE
jgi:hypothetical protein